MQFFHERISLRISIRRIIASCAVLPFAQYCSIASCAVLSCIVFRVFPKSQISQLCGSSTQRFNYPNRINYGRNANAYQKYECLNRNRSASPTVSGAVGFVLIRVSVPFIFLFGRRQNFRHIWKQINSKGLKSSMKLDSMEYGFLGSGSEPLPIS